MKLTPGPEEKEGTKRSKFYGFYLLMHLLLFLLQTISTKNEERGRERERERDRERESNIDICSCLLCIENVIVKMLITNGGEKVTS